MLSALQAQQGSISIRALSKMSAIKTDDVLSTLQALQLVTGVLQSRGGDDEVMRQLQAAKARAATERKLKEKLRGMKDSR